MTACDCCKREGVEVGTNFWFKPAQLCIACRCTWYSEGGNCQTWADLAIKSLDSGNKWFNVKGSKS